MKPKKINGRNHKKSFNIYHFEGSLITLSLSKKGMNLLSKIFPSGRFDWNFAQNSTQKFYWNALPLRYDKSLPLKSVKNTNMNKN